MLNKILEMEQEIGIEGNGGYTDNIIRFYSCKPNYNLKKFLNTFTDNYYDDMGFEEIDEVSIYIYKDYDISVVCWNEDEEQINDDILIKTNRNLEFFLLMLFSMKEEE